jgi:hypothetical protein
MKEQDCVKIRQMTGSKKSNTEVMQETPKRRITVTSSSKDISMDQQRERVWFGGGRRYSVCPHPFLQQ